MSSTRDKADRIPSRFAVRISTLLFGCCLIRSALAQSPPNDHFTNAMPLYGSSVAFTGTLASATFEAGEDTTVWLFDTLLKTLSAGGSIWWSWTATNTTAVVINALAPVGGTNTAFAVYPTGNFSQMTGTNAVHYSWLDDITNRWVGFQASAGETYIIRAFGEATDPVCFRLEAGNAPVIQRQPESQVAPAGGSVVFQFLAAGGPLTYPTSYQWRFEGSNLVGQTKPLLLMHGLSTNQAGQYTAVASGAGGAVTSSVAQLIVSPVDPRPELIPLNMPDTNRFFFTLNGLAGRRYRIESSTNLLNWTNEPSIAPSEGSDLPTVPGIVLSTNSTSLFSVVRDATRKFLRSSPYVTPEACIAHLREIDAGLQISAIEWRKGLDDYVTFTDILPWVRQLPSCPALSGQPFAEGYYITNRNVRPNCLVSPAVHRLPP